MAHALGTKNDKWDLMRLQSFCKAKDTVKRTKPQPTDRGLISKVYKELKKLDTRESNNPIKKWVQS